MKSLSRVTEGLGPMTSGNPQYWEGANSCRMYPFILKDKAEYKSMPLSDDE